LTSFKQFKHTFLQLMSITPSSSKNNNNNNNNNDSV